MSQPFALGTVLGERYMVTGKIVETGDGDSIFDGQDQLLDRKVSIIVAGTSRGDKLLKNARAVASSPRSSVQILDLGQSDSITYLVTSHTRPAILTRSVLGADAARKASDTSALGEHIFGDTAASTQTNAYVAVNPENMNETEPIQSSKSLHADPVVAAPMSPAPAYDPHEFEVEPEQKDEDSGSGMWLIAIAAVILLLIGAAVVYSQLGAMIDKSSETATPPSHSSPAHTHSTAATSTAPSPSATPTPKELPKPELTGKPTRLVPANPAFMADQDGLLGQTTDGNPATQWLSYGFGSANFGGLVDSFTLSYELKADTSVSELVMNQVSGSGGSFTVLTNSTNSLDGAVEVGSGTFNAPEIVTKLNKEKQDGKTKYVLIRFNEAPLLAQPITPAYVYGIRLAEVSVR